MGHSWAIQIGLGVTDGTTTSQVQYYYSNTAQVVSTTIKIDGSMSNYYSKTTSVCSASSPAQGLNYNHYLTWLVQLTWHIISGAEHCKSTWMMAFANSEDPWINYI
jgi:hypothetical protein